MDMNNWRREGEQLAKATSATQWRIVDWLKAGEAEFGKKAYEEAAAIFDYTVGSLRNMVSVASKVSLRNDNLTFNHHVAVAPLPSDQQAEWLKRAEAEELSATKLRDAIKAQAHTVTVQLASGKYERLKSVAEAQGSTVEALIAEVIDAYLDRPDIAVTSGDLVAVAEAA